MAPSNLRKAGDRIEVLLDELRSTADPAVWSRVEEVLGLLTDLYGEGLAHVVRAVTDEPGGHLLVGRLAEDELVSSLLVLHGLHPQDLATRVEEALEGVRPYLASHGGDVEILGFDPDSSTLHLRLLGSCDGCPSSSVTLRSSVERAIEEAAPEIARIDVEGVGDDRPDLTEPPPVVSTPVHLGRAPVAVGAPR